MTRDKLCTILIHCYFNGSSAKIIFSSSPVQADNFKSKRQAEFQEGFCDTNRIMKIEVVLSLFSHPTLLGSSVGAVVEVVVVVVGASVVVVVVVGASVVVVVGCDVWYSTLS